MGVAVAVPVGVGLGVGVRPDCAQYLPPVLKKLPDSSLPPQTIISLSVHTPVCEARAEGALVLLVALQLSVLASYLPPLLTTLEPSNPPQMIISVPVQTAECPPRAEGALVVLVATQLSLLGSYLPPVFK